MQIQLKHAHPSKPHARCLLANSNFCLLANMHSNFPERRRPDCGPHIRYSKAKGQEGSLEQTTAKVCARARAGVGG